MPSVDIAMRADEVDGDDLKRNCSAIAIGRSFAELSRRGS
jgi:hypothetical protein